MEVNNQGILTLASAYKRNVPLMYKQDFQQGVEITKDQIGTRTTGGFAGEQTKNFLIGELKGYIREELIEDTEKKFLGETVTFVRDAKGKMGAQGKSNKRN